MNRTTAAIVSVFTAALSSACSAVVTPGASDAGADAWADARVDATNVDVPAAQDVPSVDVPAACVFSNGARCEVGQVCPSPDGCNTCMCFAGPTLGCTTRGCVDAGPPSCRLPGGGLCPRGQRCPAGDGCNTCTCGPDGSLSCTEIACVDAGPRRDVACAGAAVGPMGTYCAGPDDGPLPVECCTGWSCDARRVACNALPPACPRGYVAAVASGCWGPCVPAVNCAPMRCLGGAQCPPGWRCDDVDTCAYAPR